MTDFIFTVETTSSNETFTIPHGGGTFSYTVSWGDGNSDTGVTSSPTHTYTTAGTYTITITGTFPSIKFNNGGDKLKVRTVQQLGDVGWTSFYQSWYGCSNMTSFTANTGADTSSVTSMATMFYDCSSLTSLDLDDFNTSSVTRMENMLRGCSSLTSLDLDHFNTSSVTKVANMFRGCSSLTSLAVSNFDTSLVSNLSNMFYDCSSLTSLDVSSFNTSSVTVMSAMFFSCSSLTSLDLNNFDTSSVTSMASMFYDCSSLTSLDVSSFDTSSVTSMATMLRGCSSLTSLDVSNFDTSSVTSMATMFFSCSNLTGITIHGWNVESLTNGSNMFNGANSAISTAEYDRILKNWSKQSLQSNVSVHFGDAEASTAVTSPKLTYGTTSNSTMTNSSGEIVWAPHNLALNSAAPATQTITVVSGADYTVEVTGTGSMALSGAGTGTATASSPVTITASTTSLTITLTGSLDTVAVYRSDLGGMAPVPGAATGFEYYVPTAGAVEYLPRVGHHVYDTTTSTWVNEGLLLESEARTNVRTYSTVPDGSNAYRVNATSTSSSETAPDGSTDAVLLTATGTSASNAWDNYNNTHGLYSDGGSAEPTGYETVMTYSFWIKAEDATSVTLGLFGKSVTYTFATDSITTPTNATGHVEHYGNGWVRLGCTATQTNQFHYWQVKLDGVDDTTKTAHVWGVQLEIGEAIAGTSPVEYVDANTMSSYMPSNATTQGFRDAQTLTVPSSEFGWPEPEYIGPELVVDGSGNWVGDFDVAADLGGWSQSGTTLASVSGGTATVSYNGGNATLSKVITVTAGKVYRVTGSISNVVSTGPRFKLGSSAGATDYLNAQAAGDYDEIIVATSGTLSIYVQCIGAGSLDLDNVSVREINPLSVSIQMDGRMTYADENSGGQGILHRWQRPDGTRIAAFLDSNRGTGGVRYLQIANTIADTVQDGGSSYTPGILTPFNISSRHGSTFINGAVDGTALTADTTPTALPDLSGTNLQIAYDFMGTIGQFRQWNEDIGETGIEEASS